MYPFFQVEHRSRSKRNSGNFQNKSHHSNSEHVKYSRSSPSQIPSQSCPSPPVLFKQNESSSGSRRHLSGSSHKSSKRGSNSSRRTGMKKSSFHKRNADQDQETLSGSDKEEVSITNNLQEILLKKRDSNFAKSCKISEIYSGRITSASGSSAVDKTVSSRKRQSSSTSKPSTCGQSSDISRQFDSMPTLHNFASKFLSFIHPFGKFF